MTGYGDGKKRVTATRLPFRTGLFIAFRSNVAFWNLLSERRPMISLQGAIYELVVFTIRELCDVQTLLTTKEPNLLFAKRQSLLLASGLSNRNTGSV